MNHIVFEPTRRIGKTHHAQNIAYCHDHALRRAKQRGIAIDDVGLMKLENLIVSMLEVFHVSGMRRYRLIVKRPKDRLMIVFDTTLMCIVTVWPAARLGHPLYRDQKYG